MAEPKIYTRNYVDDQCDITVSSGDAFKTRLRDRDKDSQWVSDGENSDATESSVQVDFKEGGDDVERTINRVILVNHNLEDPIAEYWDGDSWESLDSETDLTESTTIFTFNDVATQKIRIRNSQTQTTNEEKAIGELIACELLLAFSQDLTQYEVSHVDKSYEVMLADGGIHKTYNKNSLNRVEKYEARVSFEFLTQAEIVTLQSIKSTGRSFLWHPETTQRPDEIYEVLWRNPLRYRYQSSYKGAGYRMEMELRER